jgi:dethiobiotin synthetase
VAAYFVTGTDTGVGKTLIAAALLHAASAAGLRSIGIKPVAAGCSPQGGRPVNADALLLQANASVSLPYEQVNPVALQAAMAPHLAAGREGRPLVAQELARHCRAVAATDHDLLLAEGAGGWLVPLNDRETMADLAASLGWPVILVVGMRLGCLNHALLSAGAIHQAGLELAGWVANSPWPAMPALGENVASLDSRLAAPRLGAVPFLDGDAEVGAVTPYLDISRLQALAHARL